jgi:ABC-type lipopolysaccharide export system ATPase subunit
MSAVLIADSIGRRFRERRVLSAASIAVQPGRVTALLGRNGCGKTTLLRIITGLVRADHGQIIFQGERQARPALHRMAARGLFFIPERDLLGRGRSAGDHWDAMCRRWNCDPAHAEALVDRFRLVSLFDRPSEHLSTGERRRVEFALAMLRQPACLLADEPFLGIAPRDAEMLVEAIRGLAATGAGVLATGHEVELLLDVCDDVVWLTAGTTHPLGPPDAARANHGFRREYLGPGRAAIRHA